MLVEVTCAIIELDGKVLAVQRSESMSLPLKWEFPGGKMEPGESYHECLLRELEEELDIQVEVLDEIKGSVQSYPHRIIHLIPFICRITGGKIHLHEHNAMKWLSPDELFSVDWAPADLQIVEHYLKYIEV